MELVPRLGGRPGLSSVPGSITCMVTVHPFFITRSSRMFPDWGPRDNSNAVAATAVGLIGSIATSASARVWGDGANSSVASA